MGSDLNGDIELEAARNARTRTAPSHGYNYLLERNLLGIIDNPILYRNPTDLEHDVRTFHENHRLANVVDVELLIRGAQLARDRDSFLSQGHLSEVERSALEKEENPKLLDQPKELKVVLLTCCIGAIVQGWSQANITGANLSWPKEFGMSDQGWLALGSAERARLWPQGRSVHRCHLFAGFVDRVWICAEHCPSLKVKSVHPRYELVVKVAFSSPGRRLQIASAFIPAVPLFFLVLICSESPHWLVKHNNYEGAYKALRGLRDTPLQAARSSALVYISMLYAFSLTSVLTGDLYQLHCQLQVETILLGRGDVEHEINSWTRNANDQLYQREINRSNFFKRLLQLFTIQRNRRASLAACVVMASQQLSGINIFAFLAASFIFSTLGHSEEHLSPAEQADRKMKTLWLSFGFALANAVFSPLAYFSIDSRGRRFLLLLSLVLMFPLLIAAGFSLEINNTVRNNPARVGVFEFFLILYTAAYSPGAGVVPFMYSSEIFPLVNRANLTLRVTSAEVGMSLSCSVNFLLAGLLALTVPQLQNALGQTRLLGLFAKCILTKYYINSGLDALAIILVWLFVPGTRETVSLEEFNYIFGVPTGRHIEYQMAEVLPWIVREYVPWLFTRYLPWAVRHYFLRDSKAGPYPGEELPVLDELYWWNSLRRMDVEGLDGDVESMSRSISRV
ncbi:Sugar transporter [Rasamsonia emersonii CBS 393.64]|uniref:Sugar transporter n=1 Tax=Rasamsonia emersonii (strain ATCC 16479 / CBS 393.64 / IMI 116815) TaxID=1408163 RepID=A0A0F4YYL4_RASE3|nr:Sugar transporter [Rasamsonia emersonii CBS 393.64]KKA23334.1 Sugar transporter [Rasamsonia emersonii CBS 393.64]